jgi:eukaryotic-like serine/threonine-protein kinase
VRLETLSTFSSEQWRAVSPYLDHALDLPDAERSVWLAVLRKQDPVLASQVEALLVEQRVLLNEGFLEDRGPGLFSASGLAGQTLGAYTLLSQIGQGGMGSVWLAERNDGRFERRVAVKLLNFALMGQDGEERFRREGNILGRLAHPHIAQLLDAGVSPSGQPYLVLDHIDGDHIDQYCDHKRLDVRARVRLFLDVVDAVANAHASLVVHRDLKPSNVLVRKDGQVKLLDFGIAKLLRDESQVEDPSMVTGAHPLTPQYASPEQLKSDAVTTATDVYALGVLLYVLLTGQHPAGRDVHTPAELVKAIVEIEPMRPSEAVAATRDNRINAAATAFQRSTTPDKLQRALRGDLDTIVAKALKKDPCERYCSASAMADDLRHYLRYQTIGARPDTLTYRAAKFVRRNRTMVVLVTLAIVGTSAGIVGTWMQTRKARSERDFAFRQLLRAESVNEFNEFLLSDAAPSGRPFTVDELLGRAESVIERQHENGDTNRVELLVSIGDQYSTQDDDAKARRVLEEAYTLSHNVPSPSTRAQASCALAGALARDGDLMRAEGLFQEGMHELPNEPQYALDRILCLRRGSEVAQQHGDSKEGIGRILEAQRILKASPFDSDMGELRVSLELAEAYRMAGKNREAAENFEKAAQLLSSLGRENTQTAVVIFNDWALALDRLGRPLQAEQLFLRAISTSRTDDTDEAVSPMILNNYAKTLRQLGRLVEADHYAERAYTRAEQTDNQLVIDQSLYVRALIYLDQHDNARAAAMLQEVEPRLRHRYPPDSYWFGALASAQSMLADSEGDLKTSSKLADEAVRKTEAAINSGKQGADFLPIALLRRSTVKLASGQHDEAEADATRALQLFQASTQPGATSAYIGHAYLTLGHVEQARGKSEEARAAFRSAAEHFQNTLGPDHPDTREAQQLANS